MLQHPVWAAFEVSTNTSVVHVMCCMVGGGWEHVAQAALCSKAVYLQSRQQVVVPFWPSCWRGKHRLQQAPP